jgi:hypothetical protein
VHQPSLTSTVAVINAIIMHAGDNDNMCGTNPTNAIGLLYYRGGQICDVLYQTGIAVWVNKDLPIYKGL